MTNSSPWDFAMALIEIDGLPNLKMVDLSMAIAVSHNQMVNRMNTGLWPELYQLQVLRKLHLWTV